jgi:tetratricopeptide (TPR) repeat protein
MKKSILLCIMLLLLPALTAGESLYEKQLNRGIRNSDPYASLLIEQSKAESSKSMELLREAVQYSPDLPAVYFELAKNSFSPQPDRVFESVDYLLQGISTYKKNFWWSFMLLSSLLTSLLLSFLLATGIIIIIRLLKDIPLISHEIQENKNKALMLLVLIPAFFGPLYLLGSLLILLGLYMNKWDKGILYLYIVFLLISPWIFYALSTAFLAPASGPLKAAVEVNEARGNTYALSVLQNRDNPVELFSYALASKREGKYREAIASYNKLLSLKPDPRVYNNLANCYVALRDMETAKELYKKSSQIRPSATTLYNLSQVHRETFDFDKGKEFFLEAQKLDRDAVSQFRSIFGRKPNRFVIDEGLPGSMLWNHARTKTYSVTTMGLSLLPPFAVPVVVVLMGILFYAMNTRIKSRAYRCTRCGRIMCNKCEKHILWGHMCPQCFKSLVKLDELDARERIARILNVYEYKKKQRDIIKLLSLVLAGSGFIYAGNIVRGMLFLWPFLFFLLIPAVNALFVIGMPNSSHFWLNTLSLFLMGVIYVLANVITRRRIAKGWL